MDSLPLSQPAQQQAAERPHIRFILSRGAGKGRAHALAQEILKQYPKATHSRLSDSKETAGDVTISLTHGPDDVRDLAAQWDEFWGETGVCYVAGGDGSVSEVAAALAGKGCAFGVLPVGTGNDFARGLNSGDIGYQAAINLVAATKNAHFHAIDLLSVNDTYCVNVFSLGYDTEVLQETLRIQRRFRFLGSSAYVLGVLRTLWWPKSVPLTFSYQDVSGQIVQVEQDCTAFVVGNGRRYGGGYMPLPDALLDDSVADFVYADSLSLLGFARLLWMYRRGSHVGKPHVHTSQILSLEVSRTDGQPLLWNIDGLIHESPSVRIKNVPRAVVLAHLEVQ